MTASERDCEHGQLARSCDRCADAREIADLRDEADNLRWELDATKRAREATDAECARLRAECERLRATIDLASGALAPGGLYEGTRSELVAALRAERRPSAEPNGAS